MRRAAERVTAQAHEPYVCDAFFMLGQMWCLFYMDRHESTMVKVVFYRALREFIVTKRFHCAPCVFFFFFFYSTELLSRVGATLF